MFCPNCGAQENGDNQFCRACGTNISSVRVMLDTTDSFVASAHSARDEIGRAVAAKIQQTNSSSELSKFAEDVLPEIEKFLESPEERKLRRLRIGSTVSLIGLGVAIGFLIASQVGGDEEIIVVAALGLITMFIGLAIILNGLFFTVPKEKEYSASDDLGRGPNEAVQMNAKTNDLLMPASAQREFTSVTEHTTRHLERKKRNSH